MLASPVLLVTLASTLLFGGLAQPPIDTTCPPQVEVPPEDAAEAEAVVRDLVAALSAAAAPGADAGSVAAAEAAIAELMTNFVPPDGLPGNPPPALVALDYLWLPHPTDPSTPLTVGEPLELNGLPPIDGRDAIALTVEVSNGPETRWVRFWLLREGGEWRVLHAAPVALTAEGCYVIAPPEMPPGEGGIPRPVVTGGPVVVTSSPIAVGEGELPPGAPPLGDPSGAFPPEPTGPVGLHVVNADGSGLTSLAPTLGVAAWSPDGTRLAFSRFDAANPEAGPDIAVMQADGSGQVPLTDGPGWDDSPAWSPDGTRIAFLRNDWNAATSTLYVVNADGSGLTELADAAPTYPYAPSWSPDGRMIAYAGPGSSIDTSGLGAALDSDVWVVGADGRAPVQLTDLPGEVTGPTWSPDGTRIAFADSIYQSGGPYENALYVVNPDGTELTALTEWQPPRGMDPNPTRPDPPDPESTAIQSNPAWSPDGSRITFATIWGLAVIDADGSNLTVLAVDELQVWDPVWSPDGTQIAFSGSTMEAYPDIYLINPDGSSLTQVAGTDWPDIAIAWSPDGTKIAFTVMQPSGD